MAIIESSRDTAQEEAILRKYQVGATVTEYTFTSTSFGDGFSGDHKFLIQTKTGVNVSSISQYTGEKEVLIPAGAQFKVTERQQSGSTVYIHMTEIQIAKTIKTYKNGVLVKEVIANPTPAERATIKEFEAIIERDWTFGSRPFPANLQAKMQAEADAGIAETERIIAKEKKIKEANQ